MPLPKKLKIGNLTYSVQKIKELRDDRGRIYGQHNSVKQRILLDMDNTPERDKEVLIHELLHAIWGMFDLPNDGEEHYVECIGNGLATILADNPKLRRYLDD